MHIDELICPIASRINPHYEQVLEASKSWVGDHGLVSEGRATRTFDRLRIPEFVARAYPYASAHDLRIVTDWTVWGFLADDEHDRLTHRPDLLRRRFLEHVQVLEGDMCAALATTDLALADLRARILHRSNQSTLHRFARSAAEWFDSMHWEATYRSRGTRPTLAEYLRAREVTVGMYTEYALFDVTHQVETSPDFWNRPDLRLLMAMAANVIGWSNDLFSFAKEREIGDPHNLVLLLLADPARDEEMACRTVVEMHNDEMLRFLALSESTMQSRDGTVRAFVQMLHHWIRANMDWARASNRYGLNPAPSRVPEPRIDREWSPRALAA